MADILEESRNPATEAYRAAHIANSSNSTPNSNSNPSKKGKNKKKGKKKASYNVKGQNYSAKSAEQASFMLGSYNLAVEEEEEEESDSSSNSSSSSDSNTQLAQLLALKGYKKCKDFKGKGLKTSSNNKAKYKDNQPIRRPRDPALYNSWLYNTGSTDHISNSKERFTTFTPNTGQLRPINTGNGPVSPAGIGSIILEVLSRKAPPTYTKLVLDNVLYLPNININIVSRVRHYDSGGCLIKETLYRGDRRCIAVLDFKKSGFFLDVKGSSKPILHANFAFPLGLSSYTTKSIEPQRNKIVVEIPSNSIRKEDYRPIIEDAIVSEAIEPNKRYKLRNSPAKGTTLEGWLSRSLNRPTKSHLNAAKNLFKYLNSTKDYSICFSYNGNTVANLGPKLSNSSNTTTKLSRDFHSKEGPRPLTTTSTTIVDSRNSKGSSRTSIINSSLVPIGFINSDFAGDKATSKSTYGYLYKLAVNSTGYFTAL
ncbi:hypothetical protein P8C59_000200 [Phyllachora maydis]|uniref:Retrovirus-related Pol polyprotein from transposon TNT 1-94-like beta-barrel domain-containing protein n=1 Tax=Phyllachora maydis TaxID=1825666 RepID=A0AAD9HVN5_9PEZI|nr:hypothetical protein P8C59_000200 [Phyllachora maydis]